MRRVVHTILQHIVENPNESLKDQHCHCPQGPDTWCRFWRDRVANQHTSSENGRLLIAILKDLKPIFERLRRQLEAKVTIGECETVGNANTGTASKATMIQGMGMSTRRNMYEDLRGEGKVCIHVAARRTSSKYRMRERS